MHLIAKQNGNIAKRSLPLARRQTQKMRKFENQISFFIFALDKKKQLSCADFSIAKKAVDDLREDVICTVIIIADRKNISL